MKPFEMVVVDTKENEDGSLDISYTLDDEATKRMAGIGVEFVLYCAAAGVDLQDALDNIVKDLK